MKHIVLILWSLSLHAEEDTIRKKVFLTDQGYLIPNKEDFSQLDFLAKNGKLCISQRDYNMQLVAQIQRAKIASDSNVVVLQRELYNMRVKSLDRESALNACRSSIIKLEGDLNDSRQVNNLQAGNIKKLKWQNFGLKTGSGAVIGLLTYLLLK